MSDYTDAKGTVYTIGRDYDVGEIVLLSEETKEAWRMDKHVLAEARVSGEAAGRRGVVPTRLVEVIDGALTMFKDMLESNSVGSQEIHLHQSQSPPTYHLHHLVDAIRCGIIPSDSLAYQATWEIIEDLLRYDCIIPAQRLLFQASSFLPSSQLFDALVLASRLDHLPSACRIIPQGYRSYNPVHARGGMPLCPDAGEAGPWTSAWTASDASRFQPRWLWALMLATVSCRGRAPPNLREALGDPVYWKTVLGEFVANLAT